MGWAARANHPAPLTLEQRARLKALREDRAFASLRELYDRAPHEAIAILAKIPDRKERCKVMLALGLIDHIEEPKVPHAQRR